MKKMSALDRTYAILIVIMTIGLSIIISQLVMFNDQTVTKQQVTMPRATEQQATRSDIVSATIINKNFVNSTSYDIKVEPYFSWWKMKPRFGPHMTQTSEAKLYVTVQYGNIVQTFDSLYLYCLGEVGDTVNLKLFNGRLFIPY